MRRLAAQHPIPGSWNDCGANSILLGHRRAQGAEVSAVGRPAAAGKDARGSPSATSIGLSSQVHIANQCEVGGLRLGAAGVEGVREPGAPDTAAAAPPVVPGPPALAPAKPGGPGRPRDPNTCFFEGQQRPHGARWAPNYDPLCSLCTCQVGGPGRAHCVLGSGARGLDSPVNASVPLCRDER